MNSNTSAIDSPPQQHQQQPTPPQPQKPARTARGSYSKLICLNCRSRKIKCILPVQDDSITPSGSPQAADRACVRCQQQGLECIIDRTILGRPSSKRKQHDEASQKLRRKSMGSSDTTSPAILEDDVTAANPDDVDVAGFMLAEVEDEIDKVAAHLPRRERPEDHEVYQSLIDPYHLIATVIKRDKKFGTACNSALISGNTDPLSLLRGPLIDTIDERLAWVRLYFPYVPPVATLLKEYIVPTIEVAAPSVSTKALVLILTLIAIDARSDTPLPAELSRDSVLAALARCGLELLFTPPAHRNTIIALELIMEYWPTALVTGQNAAAPCLKGELYVTLMKRVADKLALHNAPKTLRAKLTNPTAPTNEIADLVHDCLLWARICYLDGSIGALIVKWPAELAEVRSQLEDATSAVAAAFAQYLHLPVASKFLYMRLVIRMSEVHAYGDIKAHRNDLAFLTTIKTAHVRTTTEQKRLSTALLERHKMSPEYPVIKELVSFDIDFIHENVSQHVLTYGVMSSFVAPDAEHTMADVLRISDEMINSVKAATAMSEPTPAMMEQLIASLPGFLARFGPSRPGEMCQHLKNIIKGNKNLSLHGIPWQPPSRETAACVLYQCKLLVEENAGRMKGWMWLCEDVDTQLLLFEDCARALDSMDTPVPEGKPSSLEQGSVLAAATKLMRSLSTIVRGWKNRLHQQTSRAIANGTNGRDIGIPDINMPMRYSNLPTMERATQSWKYAERAAMRSHPLDANDPQQHPLAHIVQQPRPPPLSTSTNYNLTAYDGWDSTNFPTWTEVNFDDWAAWPQAVPVDFWAGGVGDEDVNSALAGGSYEF